MKKLKGSFAIFVVILTLVLLIVPASASSIKSDFSTTYYFTELYPGLYLVQEDYTSGDVIDYVMTDEFFTNLNIIFDTQYKTSDSFKNGDDFITYLLADGWSVLSNDVGIYSVVEIFQDHKFTNEIDIELENYKNMLLNNGGTVTAEGFEEYLLYNNKTLYDSYKKGSYFISSEMYSAGAASSSSSGGSSGSTTPGENQGENFGRSHTNSNHEITDSDCCYIPGYNDGLLDGGTVYQNSEEFQNIINENKTEAVNEYKTSTEYKETLESVYNEANEYAVDEYLKGDEYKASIDSAFTAGSDAGYTNAYEDACSEVYNRGKTDGYAEFRGSMEYSKAVNSAYSSGWDDGVDKARNSVVNPGGVIASIFILAGLIILLFILSRKNRKKNK